MNRNDLEKFRKHVGQGKEFVIGAEGNQDAFYFEPLPTKYFPDFLFLVEQSSKAFEKDEDDLNEEVIKVAIKLITAMCCQAFPDATDEEVARFVTKNYIRLQDILAELNSDIGFNQIDPEKLQKIEEMRKRVVKQNSDETSTN